MKKVKTENGNYLVMVNSTIWMSPDNPEILGAITEDGRYKVYNGEDSMMFSVKNGKIEGFFIQYDANIGRVAEGTYVNGQKEGFWKEKDMDRYEQHGYYKNGKREGKWGTYYSSGKIMSVTPYDEGYINGIERHYHKNGKRKFKVRIINNRANGWGDFYDERGELIKKCYYRDGSITNEINYEHQKKIGL